MIAPNCHHSTTGGTDNWGEAITAGQTSHCPNPSANSGGTSRYERRIRLTHSWKRLAYAGAATLTLLAGGTAMAAGFQHSTDHTSSRQTHTSVKATQMKTSPPTIQEGLSLVGAFLGPQAETVAKAYLVSNGYPTSGVLTPSMVNKLKAGLASAVGSLPTTGSSAASSTRGQGQGSTTVASHNVLPAHFPNPANLTPVSEPSLSSPSQGIEGQFTPSVKTIDGRPVLKAFHMVATSYAPSIQDNYPYGPVDAFGQPLKNGMVAVDPNVIPLRSVVYVTGYHDNYLPSGGFLGQAMDTGGAIQGDRIDIFLNASESVVNDFGLQQVTVYQLGN